MRLIFPIITVILLFTSHAGAQETAVRCAPRGNVIDKLIKKFGEKQVSWALTKENKVIETFSNPKTKSWTILVTSTNGSTCLLAAGEEFNLVADKPGEPL